MGYRLTKKEQRLERFKCGRDPAYFLNNYGRIVHPTRGPIPFDLYPFQEEVLKDFVDHRFNIVLKSRQLGLSTATAGYVLWLILFHEAKNVITVATKQRTAANLVKKVKYMYKHLPSWLRAIAAADTNNSSMLFLDNESGIEALSTSMDALSLLVVDEAAIVEKFAEKWGSLYPTLAEGGACIALSTPKGVGNWFHETCMGALEKTNEFNIVELPWYVHPNRDKKWFDKETKNLSRAFIAQEYECNFNLSGDTFIDPEDIQRVKKATIDPMYRSGVDRNYWIWKSYDPSRNYFLISDVARGDGADYSTFHIFDVESMEQVAEYRGQVGTDLFAHVVFNAGKEYGFCMVAMENNTIGWAVLQDLQRMEYPNLYFSKKTGNDYVEPHAAEGNSSVVPGFRMGHTLRTLSLAKLEEYVRNKQVTINSIRLANEMDTFIWNNGKPEALKGKNDDLMIPAAMACWIKDTILIESRKTMQYKKAILDSISLTSRTFDTRIQGMHGYNPKRERAYQKAKQDYIGHDWVIMG